MCFLKQQTAKLNGKNNEMKLIIEINYNKIVPNQF